MAKDAEEVADDEVIARTQAILDGHVETLAKDPTASLWIQYLDMIQILRQFIRAERLGNWYLHLEVVSEMLPYLAASGHSLYAKSASIYLSYTANLPNDHRVVHQHFVEGLHVARRSDRAWAGLSTDLMIEQVLNAQQEYKWSSDQRQRNDRTAASHVVTWYAGMRWGKQSNAQYSTNEQNKETFKSRQRRDMKDTHTLLLTMSERNPFAESTSLRFIMTGVNTTGDIDVCRAKEIGQKIMDSMTGIPVARYMFKRSDQVTPLQSKSSVRVYGQPIHVDPELLFQRLIVASNSIDDRNASFRFGSLWRHTHAESTTESRSGERYLDPSATRHCRTNWRGSTCVGRWGIAPSYNMAAWAPNISRYMRPLLWLFVAKLWARHRSLRWLPHSIHQIHNTSTAHRRRSRNRGHLHRRCEVDDVEGCLPFERRQQTEHVESLPAACLMPHRTRGGGCRPVNCANSSAIGSYEEHCPHGRRYRSGHPAMLLRRPRWLRLVHAVFDTWDNEVEPHLGYQSHPKWVGCLHLYKTSFSYTRYWGVTPHPDYMVSEKDCRWRDSPPVRCSEIRLNSSARRTQQLTTS